MMIVFKTQENRSSLSGPLYLMKLNCTKGMKTNVHLAGIEK